MLKFLKNNLYLILAIVLSIPAAYALLHKGFYGASDDLHIAWLYEMDKILRIGQIPPRYVPDLSFGFGYPLFNFVFPFPYYLGEIFRFMNFSFVDCVKIVFGISFIASGVTMFYLLNEILPGAFALSGSLIYVYTPYRSTDVYIRGDIGEALSFVFFPLLLFAIIKLYKLVLEKQKIYWKYIGILSLSLGGLVLSHDIASYMFFPFLLILIAILFFSLKKEKKSFLLNNILAVGTGLLVSIYFWLPAILDSKLMSYSTVFNYLDHFPTIKQLITPYFGYGASVPGPYDLISFYIGTLNWFLLIAGIILSIIIWKKIKRLHKLILTWALITFVISFFMMNYRSAFLWAHLPFLPYFQFPWRFLMLTTLTTVIFVIPLNYINFKFSKYLIPFALAILAIVLNVKDFRPQDFLERTDAYYINRYIPVPTPSTEYLTLQEEYLRLPKDSTKRPNKDYPIIFSDKKFNYEVLSTNGMYSKIKVDLPEEETLYYTKYKFPGWVAVVDGNNAVIKAGQPFGQIAVQVPKGIHTVEFNFTETPIKIFLDIISGISILSAIAFLFVKIRKLK